MIIKNGNFSLSLGRASMKSFSVISRTYKSQSLLEPLQAFVTRWSYLGGLNYSELICGIQKSFSKFGKYSKRLSMTK